MNWPLVELSSFLEIKKGKKHEPCSNQSDLSRRFLQIDDLRNDNKIKHTLDEKGVFAEKKDVIIAWDGANAGTIGFGKEGLIGSTLAKLSFDTNIINTEYLGRFLQSKFKELRENCTGATIPHISKTFLVSLKIPLPLLETQKQIAAVLEKADQLRKDCQQMETELDSLAQSVFIDMFGDPVTNPKGWNKLTLKKASVKFHDGPFGSNLKTSHYTETGVQVIRLKNIGVGQFKAADKAYVSEDHAKVLHKFKCYPGDIVIATLGEPNLRACIIPKSVPVSINKADCVHCVVDTAIINSEYLVEYLNLPSVLHTIQNKLHGQTRTRISSGQLGLLELIIPPLKQQEEYLRLLTVRTGMNLQAKGQSKEYDNLFNSLMQKAFKGELNLK